MDLIKHNDIIFKKYISNDTIKNRIEVISSEINSCFSNEDKEIMFIGILNGSFYFMADLLKKINFNYQYQFLKLTSYKGMKSTSLINELDLDKNLLIGKNIIIIEDIIDSGKTINYIKSYFQKIQIKSIKIVSLLVKEKKDKLCDWFGFKINDKFVIGYGLDIDNQYRDLKDIYIKD
tara:strand:+ start:166 stop:696 length:531 start_codon:yes stop_codon:yes gene_type:complete